VTRWLLQGRRGGSCCSLVALLNAARFHGLRSTRIGTCRWEELVDAARCRHGAACAADEAARALGLERRPVRVGLRTFSRSLPVMAVLENPHWGTLMHSVLVVRVEGDLLDVVNYRWITGPVVERIRWRSLPLFPPGHCGREAWSVRPV
jgi:hypothetical protein